MNQSEYSFKIPLANNEELDVSLNNGDIVYVLGANGVGKSTLMTKVYTDNSKHAKRILAHRRNWFEKNSVNILASSKKNVDYNIKLHDSSADSRYSDRYDNQRSDITIFNLINSENIRARKIANFADNKDLKGVEILSNEKSVISNVNEILSISNIPIIITLNDKDELIASKSGSQSYSVAQLSDGEKNALLICTDILTTEPNQLIVLDEPERHLHRSIISPLLTTLFSKRQDCAFIVSTHDFHLPIDNSDSSVLLVRGCDWDEYGNIKNWDADLVSQNESIPDDVKQSILGSKRNVLFVEGGETSLDKSFYELIYPELSVIPKTSCQDVIRAVEGIRGSQDLHWVNAYGLVDADDRTPEQIVKLADKGVIAINAYSVESLYYHPFIIKKVVEQYSNLTGENAEDLYARALSNVVDNFKHIKDVFCARLCEKRVRDKMMSKLPTHKDILNKEKENKKNFVIDIDLNEEFLREEEIADDLISDNNFEGIILRYPIRESQILSNIAKNIGIDRKTYERIVRRLIVEDEEVKAFYRNLLDNLTNELSN